MTRCLTLTSLLQVEIIRYGILGLLCTQEKLTILDPIAALGPLSRWHGLLGRIRCLGAKLLRHTSEPRIASGTCSLLLIQVGEGVIHEQFRGARATSLPGALCLRPSRLGVYLPGGSLRREDILRDRRELVR